MTTKLNFISLRNERGLSSHVRRSAKRLTKLVPLIEQLHMQEQGQEQARNAEQVSSATKRLLKALKQAYSSVQSIQHDEQVLELRSETSTKEADAELGKVSKGVAEHMPDLERDYNTATEEFARGEKDVAKMFNKVRIEFHDLYRDRQRTLKYASAFYQSLPRIIKKVAEREIGDADTKLDDKIRRKCKDIERMITELARENNTEKQKAIKKRLESALHTLIDLLGKDSERLRKFADEVYQILHADIIIGFHIMHEARILKAKIAKLKAEGFPAKDIAEFEKLEAQISDNIRHSLLNMYRDQRYVKAQV